MWGLKMVNFLDLMGNKLAKVGNNVKNRVLNVWDFMKPDDFEETPYVEPIQVNENGDINDIESKRMAIKQAHLAKPRTLAEHLFTGRTQETDMQNINPETNEVTLETVRTYQPSFFDNLTSGAKENFSTGFAAPNLTDNTGEYGKKGFGYRLGEGIGTLGRFLESPMGRGLLVGGIVGASGGSGLEALGYGAGTTMGNQGNRMRDRAYRDDLIRSGKQAVMNSPEFKATNDPMARQAMLDNVENRVNSYRGYITDDVYRNMIDSQIAQENAAYRRMYYDSQIQNQKDMMNFREREAERQARQDMIINERENRKLKLAEDKIKRGTQKFRLALGDRKGALKQIQDLKALVMANPNATGYIIGSFAKGKELGQKVANEYLSSNPEAIKTRAAIAKLRGTTMHDLAGTAQTLQEQRNLAPFLPDSTDNAKTILPKLEQLEAELKREMSTFQNTGLELGYELEDFENNTPQATEKTKETDPLGLGL